MSLSIKSSPLKYARTEITSIVDFANRMHFDVKEASYGALGNDTGNDAPMIQDAIDDVPAGGGIVYLPDGIYRCTSGIVFPTDRQVCLVGAGATQTRIHVPAGTSATPGVIRLRGDELGSTVENLTIEFDQPNVTTVGGMTAFVPAIYAQSCTRFRIRHVRLIRAWDGIDMRGNCGGSFIEDVEMSAFNKGIDIDNSLDSIYITNLHSWVFGTTGNQQTALYNSTTSFAIHCARVDDLHITDSLFNGGRGLRFYESGNGPCWVEMTGCTLDASSGIQLEAGRLSMSGCSVGHGIAGKQPILVSGTGRLEISGSHLGAVTSDSVATIECSGGFLTIGGSRIYSQEGADTTLLKISGGQAIVNGCFFPRDPNIALTRPTVLQTTGRLSFTGNRTTDKGSGAGTFVQITTDDYHVISDNNFMLWGFTLPALQTFMSSHHNVQHTGSAIQYPRGGEGHAFARVFRTTNQLIPNAAVEPIVFDAERFDVPGWHSTSVNPTRLTAPVSGTYSMGGCMEWAPGNTSGSRYAIIRFGGSIDLAADGGPVGGSSEMIICNVSTEHYLNAGEYIEFCGYQTSGLSQNVIASSARSPEFWMTRVAP